MSDDKSASEFFLDREQVRALRDLESITQQGVREMLKESIELYVRMKTGRTAVTDGLQTMLSPIIFEPPYRKLPDH